MSRLIALHLGKNGNDSALLTFFRFPLFDAFFLPPRLGVTLCLGERGLYELVTSKIDNPNHMER